MTNPSNLYDLFVNPGIGYDEIVDMSLDNLTHHIEETREGISIEVNLSSHELAILVKGWARCQAIEEVVQRFLKKNATYKDLREVVK